MITKESLMAIMNENMEEAAKAVDKNDLPQLVEWLSEKDDNIRYKALLLLQNRSVYSDDVYPFWDIFCKKLKSDNSYQRSIGLMLIADNAKWDKDNKLDDIIDDYLVLLNDEKPITVRQCIQALCKIVPCKEHLHQKIADKIMSMNLLEVKETMRKLLLLDIISVLAVIRKYQTTDEIEKYILDALTGGLDKKVKKQIEAMLL